MQYNRWCMLVVVCTLPGSGCMPTPHWPPAVSSVNDIKELPEAQRDIRRIDLGRSESKLVSERFPDLILSIPQFQLPRALLTNSTRTAAARGG